MLPSPRFKLSVLFAHTGVDYTGHYYLREDQEGKVKAYILILLDLKSRLSILKLLVVCQLLNLF